MIYLGIAAAAFFSDFFLKKHMDRKYARKVTHKRCGGKIIIEKFYNKGATMNFLSGRPGAMRVIHTAVMIVVAAGYYLLLRLPGKTPTKIGASLLLGGGAGNLYDRYAKGHVVDYFHVNVGSAWFRKLIFNLSDFYVFVGAFLAAATIEQP